MTANKDIRVTRKGREKVYKILIYPKQVLSNLDKSHGFYLGKIFEETVIIRIQDEINTIRFKRKSSLQHSGQN